MICLVINLSLFVTFLNWGLAYLLNCQIYVLSWKLGN